MIEFEKEKKKHLIHRPTVDSIEAQRERVALCMGIDVVILFSGRALDLDGSYHSFWRLGEFCRMEPCGLREMMV